jgi:hypothetical protein
VGSAHRRCSIYKEQHNTEKQERRRVYPKVSGSITKQTKTTTINTRWEATQRVMAAKFTRLTHKIAIQLHLLAESCTICSSRSRRPVRKLLDTPSYIFASSGIRTHDCNVPVVQDHKRLRRCGQWDIKRNYLQLICIHQDVNLKLRAVIFQSV